MALNGITPARAQVTCERETISRVVSPDNTWVALVHEGVCSNGALVTVSTDTVRLAARRDMTEAIQLAPRAEKPEYENDILVVDYYGHPERRPLPMAVTAKAANHNSKHIGRWIAEEQLSGGGHCHQI